ncbi:MAG: N-acetylneuraminate synthase family protein [Minwuia sp.]|uniref:N-acetylneuraminate synthase family protein n=1 Tax=Minwuia sp. TaxID=2493630 RepID=UPI003A8B9990
MTFIEKLTDPARPVIVGEVSQNHDGSLGMAHAYVDALADVGADAIKFQTHIANEELTLDDQFRVKFSYQDSTRYDYWRRMEFTEEQWLELKRHADERGIGFLSTPFSVAAVELLSRIGVDAWKIGSGDTLFREMSDAILATGKPLIVSSGMSDWQELDGVVSRVHEAGTSLSLLQCTTQYPTRLEDVGLNNLELMKERYGVRVGLSDHSGSTSPSMVAIARGFPLIEVHVTFDRRMFGPDVPASLTVDEIGTLARFASDVALMDASPVDKDEMAARLGNLKALFNRSVAPSRDLPAGHVLAESDLVAKKPGGGISWAEHGQFVGSRLRREVSRNRLLKLEDLEQ